MRIRYPLPQGNPFDYVAIVHTIDPTEALPLPSNITTWPEWLPRWTSKIMSWLQTDLEADPPPHAGLTFSGPS